MVAGVQCQTLIDTGCTRSIVHVSVCRKWERRSVSVVTVSGQQLKCAGTAEVDVEVPGLRPVMVSALVVEERPLGFNVILGMDGVEAFGGVMVRSPSDVRFAGEEEEEDLFCAGVDGR